MASLIELIRKRHDGPAWVVCTEVPNGTGAGAHRRADALAVGLWPSHGFAIHGYECKASRSDVQKELADPRKADAVGKFCDHWWLVIADEKIIDGLVIPATWGILAPRNNVLRVIRKAPKRKAAPVDRAFVAALIRSVTESWVPREKYKLVKENARELALEDLKRDRQWRQEDMNHDLSQLQEKVRRFRDASGVDLEKEQVWAVGDIGKVVELVMRVRSDIGVSRNAYAEAKTLVEREAADLERAAGRHDIAAAGMRSAAENARRLVETLAASPEEASEWANEVEASLVDERQTEDPSLLPGLGMAAGVFRAG